MVSGLTGRAVDRVRQAWVRIALDGATAMAAFVLAQVVLRQPAPIFAPIAAVVCLTDAPAARGPRALRLLLGVVAGVAVGELAKVLIGSGWLQVGAAVVVAMLIVSLGSINPLALLQAGIAALLVVGIGSSQAGWTRLASALVGGALALVVSQVLVTPSPTRQFADAVATALRGLADGLRDVGSGLRSGSPEAVRTAAEGLRGGHGDVADILDARTTSTRLARTTLRGRRERAALVAMQRRYEGLEYVHAGSVLLARTAVEVLERGDDVPPRLVDGVDELAGVVGALAEHPRDTDPTPDDRDVRSAHDVAEDLAGTDPESWAAGAARLATQLHLLAEDVAALTDPRRSHVATRGS